MVERTKIITPPFRVSFPSVFEPSSYQGGEPKYSVVMLFYPDKFNEADKKAFAALKAVADVAAMEKFKKPVKDFSDNMRKPIRRGEEKAHLEGYGEGCVFATASSKQRPGLIDKTKQEILDKDAFYPGCWARATVTAFAYDNKGKGVAFGLHNIQKLGDGENFTGRVAADEDFGDDASVVWGGDDTAVTEKADPLA